MSRLVTFLVVVYGTGLFGQTQTVPTPGAISGVVVDAATGAPLSDAYVQLQRLFGGTGAPLPRKVTDAKGRFIFAPVAGADGYLLTVTRAGYLDGGFHRGPADEAGALFSLQDGQWRNDLTIRLWKSGRRWRSAVGGRHGAPRAAGARRCCRPLDPDGYSHQ